MENCIFCDREKIAQDVLYESENFFVKVGFGIVSAGHVMLIPKEHYLCYAELPDRLDEEYGSVKKRLLGNIKSNFSLPFLIEYGIFGQSIQHAHLHFIPHKGHDYEVRSIVEEMVIPSGIKFEEADKE